MGDGIVIVGGGQAAASAAAKMRDLDSSIAVTMICEEPVLPYQRPPLSKSYLSGDMPLERLVLRPQEWFDDQNVAARTGTRVTSIDRGGRSVALSNGETLPYDKLLLATGSRARRLPQKMGGELRGVFTLRTTLDADGLAPVLDKGGELLIVGGGYIGLEVAAVAAKAGLTVTVVEMADRILQRVASEETSNYFRDLHTRNKVRKYYDGTPKNGVAKSHSHWYQASTSNTGKPSAIPVAIAGAFA